MKTVYFLLLLFAFLFLEIHGESYLNMSAFKELEVHELDNIGEGQVFRIPHLLNATACTTDDDCRQTAFGEFSTCLSTGSCHCMQGILFTYQFRSHSPPFGCVLHEKHVTEVFFYLLIFCDLPLLFVALVVYSFWERSPSGGGQLKSSSKWKLIVTFYRRMVCICCALLCPLGCARSRGQEKDEDGYIDLTYVASWKNTSTSNTTEGILSLLLH